MSVPNTSVEQTANCQLFPDPESLSFMKIYFFCLFQQIFQDKDIWLQLL